MASTYVLADVLLLKELEQLELAERAQAEHCAVSGQTVWRRRTRVVEGRDLIARQDKLIRSSQELGANENSDAGRDDAPS